MGIPESSKPDDEVPWSALTVVFLAFCFFAAIVLLCHVLANLP